MSDDQMLAETYLAINWNNIFHGLENILVVSQIVTYSFDLISKDEEKKEYFLLTVRRVNILFEYSRFLLGEELFQTLIMKVLLNSSEGKQRRSFFQQG